MVGQSNSQIVSVHPKAPTFGFKQSAVSDQLSAKVL